MRVVFELESEQDLSEIREFFQQLDSQGEVEVFSQTQGSGLPIKYRNLECSVQSSLEEEHKVLGTAIFIPDKHTHIRIDKHEIYHIEADGSYIKVFTKTRNFHVSSNLKVFSLQLKDTNFIRVSRKHVINVIHLHKIDGNTLYVGPYEIQLSKNQRKHILERFPILHTRYV